jgi:hypothetical protein
MMRLLYVMLAGCMVSTGAFSADWEVLSAGNDLSGWRVEGGEWSIADGVITGRAGQDANCWLLWEKKEYADFELSAEFRTPVPTNGGIQFRSHWLPRVPLEEGETAADAPRQMYGYQANVETRQRTGTGRLMDENGRGYLAETPVAAAKTLSQKGWNTMRIVARGPVIEVYLHDVLAHRTEDNVFLSGLIALQVFPFQQQEENASVEYRNVKIKDYSREGAWRPLFNGKNFDGWKQWGGEEWAVEDGVIYGRSGPKKSEGYLATEEQFTDFRVRGRFKMLGEGNFGLFYHSAIKLREDDGYPLISGLQGEVAPAWPGPSGWVYESYKRGWLVKPDLASMPAFALRPDEWNEIELLSRATGEGKKIKHITTWVNGIQVLNHTDEAPNLYKGSFALQLHAGGVDGIAWKDIAVLDE